MRIIKKMSLMALLVVVFVVSVIGFSACNKKDGKETVQLTKENYKTYIKVEEVVNSKSSSSWTYNTVIGINKMYSNPTLMVKATSLDQVNEFTGVTITVSVWYLCYCWDLTPGNINYFPSENDIVLKDVEIVLDSKG